MKLKRIALATAAALAAPAAALAQSNVQIYGTLNGDFESVKATGSATGVNFPSRNRVTSNSSNVRLRGTEDLGQGRRAFFQIESFAGFDTGTTWGFGASRNPGVGLRGGGGQVFLGQWDSPYKSPTPRSDPPGNPGTPASPGILGGTGSIPAG